MCDLRGLNFSLVVVIVVNLVVDYVVLDYFLIFLSSVCSCCWLFRAPLGNACWLVVVAVAVAAARNTFKKCRRKATYM